MPPKRLPIVSTGNLKSIADAVPTSSATIAPGIFSECFVAVMGSRHMEVIAIDYEVKSLFYKMRRPTHELNRGRRLAKFWTTGNREHTW
jgi:hypothetical protein